MPSGDSNPTVDKIGCNVHLFCVLLRWTGSVQMKSSMPFIRGNRCIEREKDILKIGREVKRLKEPDLFRISSGFHGAYVKGVASQQGTLTLPGTWFCPFLDLLMLQLLRKIFPNVP